MFTGIIEETGTISKISLLGSGRKLTIAAKRILEDLKVEDSVCISGVCLTAVHVGRSDFTIEAVGATLEKTTVGEFRPGRQVNLERAMQPKDRFGGHLVQGHVNGVGKIATLNRTGDSWTVVILIPEELEKYVISEGSIAIDGISLTVAGLTQNRIQLSIIPYTWEHTTLQNSKVGDLCNIETDIIAKYIEKLLPDFQQKISGRKITIDGLKKAGY